MISPRILLALAALLVFVQPPSLCAAGPERRANAGSESRAEEREITRASVVAQMNIYRAEHGLTALVEDHRLDDAADDRMRDMEDGSYWSHQSPDGRSPFTYLAPRGYRLMRAGENLAAGFDTVQVLVGAWMDSPGHRANILGAGFRDCGVAIIDGATTGPASGKSIVVLFAAEQ